MRGAMRPILPCPMLPIAGRPAHSPGEFLQCDRPATDARGMSERSWTTAELENHVVGKRLTLWSPATLAQLPVPPWLLGCSSGTLMFDMAEMAKRTHPADRGVASGLMLQALGAPGERFTGT